MRQNNRDIGLIKTKKRFLQKKCIHGTRKKKKKMKGQGLCIDEICIAFNQRNMTYQWHEIDGKSEAGTSTKINVKRAEQSWLRNFCQLRQRKITT